MKHAELYTKIASAFLNTQTLRIIKWNIFDEKLRFFNTYKVYNHDNN